MGGLAAELLYVQDKQINLRVPQRIPLKGSTSLVVHVGGTASPPLLVETGIEVMSASVEQVAYTGMPVWLTVRTPEYWVPEVHYPFELKPQHMGCNQVEMKRNGEFLEQTWQPASGGVRLKFNCGTLGLAGNSARSRLPLHLIYRMDKPGAYQVRVLTKANQPRTSETIATTAWVSFTVHPAGPGMRRALLERMEQQVPTDAGELLSDYLPNLLGVPDEDSFRMLTPFIKHANTYVRLYAAEGYRYWPGLEPPQVGGVF